jgi:hypothetical protein
LGSAVEPRVEENGDAGYLDEIEWRRSARNGGWESNAADTDKASSTA